MKKIRAIVIGTGIWGLGVGAFTSSFFVPLLRDAELQANLVLFLVVIPLVWYGTKLYYKSGSTTQGVWVGLTFFLVAAVLDALITVPFLVVPNGGNHLEFFSDPGFWAIGIQFIGIAALYGYFRGKRTTEFI